MGNSDIGRQYSFSRVAAITVDPYDDLVANTAARASSRRRPGDRGRF